MPSGHTQHTVKDTGDQAHGSFGHSGLNGGLFTDSTSAAIGKGWSLETAPSDTARNKILQSGKNQQPEVGEQGLAAEVVMKEARGRGANRNTLYLSYSGSQPQAFVKIKLYIESWELVNLMHRAEIYIHIC